MTSVGVYLAMMMLGSNVSTAAVPEQPRGVVVAPVSAAAPASDAGGAAAVTQPATQTAAAPVATTSNVAGGATAAAVVASTAVTAMKPVVLTDEEQRFVDLVNYERASRGLNVLRIDPLLVEVSRGHSKEMCDLNYFDHVSPTPGMKTALNRYLVALKHRPTWAYLGENLFYCSIVDVNRGHTCLMDSHSHRENILNPKFERIGVGCYSDAKGQFWVTQMFLAVTD